MHPSYTCRRRTQPEIAVLGGSIMSAMQRSALADAGQRMPGPHTTINPTRLRIVLCDPQPMLLEGLSNVLTQRGHAIEAVTTEPADVVPIVRRLQPDLCVAEVRFPDGRSGLGALAQMRAVSPRTRILALSDALSYEMLQRLIRLGVNGIVPKDVGIEALIASLESTCSGQVSISKSLLDRTHSRPSTPGRRALPDPLTHLTHREREVLSCMMSGAGTSSIARRLRMSNSTARSHVQNVLSKLGVHSRLQAVVVARGGDRARFDPSLASRE